jgi:hypothetical protein
LAPSLPAFVRFLFTYRPDDDILLTFEGLPAVDISIDNPKVAHMVDDVAKAARTLFECAAVLCRELTTVRSPVLASARTDFVQRLREGPVLALYDSYKAILEMYFGGGGAELLKLFRRVMAWILLMRTPQSRRVFRRKSSPMWI